jgi:hypothetical protein
VFGFGQYGLMLDGLNGFCDRFWCRVELEIDGDVGAGTIDWFVGELAFDVLCVGFEFGLNVLGYDSVWCMHGRICWFRFDNS